MTRGGLGALVVMLVALQLAGCIGLPGDAPASERGGERASPASRDAPALDPRVQAAPSWSPPAEAPLAKRALDVSVELQEPWVRPRQPFDALAQAPEGARVAWFVGTSGGDAFVETLSGWLYLGGAAGAEEDGAHSHLPPPHERVATGMVAAGESTRAFAFWKEGRYVLAVADAPHALVNVTANASEPARDVAHVTLVEDAHGLRFSPSELRIHPATRVRFWNAASEPHAIEERRFLAAVPSDERALRIIAVHPGEYRVVAIAQDGADGWGEAEARLVIDFDSPSSTVSLGPWEGRVSSLGAVGAPTSRAHAFTLDHPLRAIDLRVRVSDGAAVAPDALSWRLLREGEEVAAAEPGARELRVEDLPPGEYALEVRAEQGLAVDYAASGEARQRLVAPPESP